MRLPTLPPIIGTTRLFRIDSLNHHLADIFRSEVISYESREQHWQASAD